MKSTSKKDITKLAESEEVTIYEVMEKPFNIVRHKDKYFLAIGNTKISEEYENLDECIMYINEDGWELRMSVIAAVINHLKTNKEQK